MTRVVWVMGVGVDSREPHQLLGLTSHALWRAWVEWCVLKFDESSPLMLLGFDHPRKLCLQYVSLPCFIKGPLITISTHFQNFGKNSKFVASTISNRFFFSPTWKNKKKKIQNLGFLYK